MRVIKRSVLAGLLTLIIAPWAHAAPKAADVAPIVLDAARIAALEASKAHVAGQLSLLGNVRTPG